VITHPQSGVSFAEGTLREDEGAERLSRGWEVIKVERI
jgi:hypothetical protein